MDQAMEKLTALRLSLLPATLSQAISVWHSGLAKFHPDEYDFRFGALWP
jgi:hypothetical protein